MNAFQLNADLAFLAYLKSDQAVAAYRARGFAEVVALHESEADRHEGYLLEQDGAITVALRGSDDLQDWLWSNLRFWMDWRRGHAGFSRSAAKIWYCIRPEIARLRCDNGVSIKIVGHSRGGAVGLHLANLMAGLGYRVELYSYGAPRSAAIEWVNQCHAFRHYRVFHSEDLVPHLPPKVLGYCHHGQPVCAETITQSAVDRWRDMAQVLSSHNVVKGLMRDQDWVKAHLSYSDAWRSP